MKLPKSKPVVMAAIALAALVMMAGFVNRYLLRSRAATESVSIAPDSASASLTNQQANTDIKLKFIITSTHSTPIDSGTINLVGTNGLVITAVDQPAIYPAGTFKYAVVSPKGANTSAYSFSFNPENADLNPPASMSFDVTVRGQAGKTSELSVSSTSSVNGIFSGIKFDISKSDKATIAFGGTAAAQIPYKLGKGALTSATVDSNFAAEVDKPFDLLLRVGSIPDAGRITSFVATINYDPAKITCDPSRITFDQGDNLNKDSSTGTVETANPAKMTISYTTKTPPTATKVQVVNVSLPCKPKAVGTFSMTINKAQSEAFITADQKGYDITPTNATVTVTGGGTGTCSPACANNETCNSGTCTACPTGKYNCDGSDANGCEKSYRCSCNGGNGCGSNAVCGVNGCACATGYTDCDSSWSNGCEYLGTECPTSGCNPACNTAAHQTCGSNNACVCASGYQNCGSGTALDCKTSCTVSCNPVCGTNQTCNTSNGTCACSTGYTDCDSGSGLNCQTSCSGGGCTATAPQNIVGYVFYDTNKNGVKDSGESWPDVNDSYKWTITAAGKSVNPGSGGWYQISSVSPGTYSVTAAVKAGVTLSRTYVFTGQNPKNATACTGNGRADFGVIDQPAACATLKTKIDAAIGKTCGQTGYDKLADIDNNKTVESSDMLAYNGHSTDGAWCQSQLDDATDPCGTVTTCNPACGSTQQCVSGTCQCLSGRYDCDPNIAGCESTTSCTSAQCGKDKGNANPNANSTIGLDDYDIWLEQYRARCVTNCSADFVGNDGVKITDYNIWYTNWSAGVCAAP